MPDVNFFISFFKQIPASRFCEDMTDGWDRHCYVGHCPTIRLARTLAKVLQTIDTTAGDIIVGNDRRYQHKSLKKRIIAALSDVRDMELGKANVKEAKSIVKLVTHFQTI